MRRTTSNDVVTNLFGIQIVAADHPSLDGDVGRFLDDACSHTHRFGRSDSERLRGPGAFRLAAVECGRVVGLVRVFDDGDVSIAISDDRRGLGLGNQLQRAAERRAVELGVPVPASTVTAARGWCKLAG